MGDVVTFGVHIADILGRYVTEIPPGQGLERIDEIRITVAGTAAATAVDLAKVGVDVTTVGLLGRDTLGDFVRRTMDDYGVDTSGLGAIDDAQTSATILPIRPDGSRPALHVSGASARLTVDAATPELLDGARIFHWGGACLLSAADGEPGAELLASLQAAGVVTTLDCLPTGTPTDRAALLPLLAHVDYFLPSLEDALALAETTDRAEAIDFFLGLGVGHVVITMGGEGVSLTGQDRVETRLPAYEVDVVDTTGCGDAFTAGLILGLLEGLPLSDCAEYGLAMGSMVATGLGSDAGIVGRASVEAFRGSVSRYSDS